MGNHHDESRIQSEELALVCARSGSSVFHSWFSVAEVVLIICQIFFLYQDFLGQAQVVDSVARFQQVKHQPWYCGISCGVQTSQRLCSARKKMCNHVAYLLNELGLCYFISRRYVGTRF